MTLARNAITKIAVVAPRHAEPATASTGLTLGHANSTESQIALR
ncbi:hypothetical protein [Mycolicibacterium moriokaense]|jgi:hypothetical protein|nr:hypothetical protein [Mycolicibacterium moriokaense]